MKIKSIFYPFLGGTLIILFFLFASIWCPWINEDFSKQKAIAHFQKSWENSNDGCYLDCDECGVTSVQKVPFGQIVTLYSKCGWTGDVISFNSENIFINFLGKAE